MAANFDISIVVAVAQNGVIGRDGAMPWRLSTDLKRFKALTMGHPIIMGRKTFDSIGKPLPGRLNIVVTRDMDWNVEGAMRTSSLPSAIDLATAHLESIHAQIDDPAVVPPKQIFVVGGGEIYRQAIGMAQLLYVTHVLTEVEGDTYFPQIDPDLWQEQHSEDVPAGEKDTVATRFVIYKRHDDAR